jgi:hypothetical protein
MERKVHNSLYEAALQVQSGITPEPEINEAVLEYFENYFGDNLNEDTSDEDIMNAVEDLVDLCEAVCDAVGLDELFKPKVKPTPYETFTKIKNNRTPEVKAQMAYHKERLARKTSGRTNLNDPPDVLDAEVIKKQINAIRAGSADTTTPIKQGWNTFRQKLKKGKYTDAEVGGTKYFVPNWRGEHKGK